MLKHPNPLRQSNRLFTEYGTRLFSMDPRLRGDDVFMLLV
jgi:hypothetical protein